MALTGNNNDNHFRDTSFVGGSAAVQFANTGAGLALTNNDFLVA